MISFIEFRIIRPIKQDVFKVEWIDIQTPEGSFVIGLNHLPLISKLENRGKLTFKKKDGKTEQIDTYGGFFKVENNKAIAVLEI